jgi:hypothetical protein
MAIAPRAPRAWVLLRTRHGGNVLEPGEGERAAALRELFHSPSEGGHDECSLEYSHDGGPLFSLVFTSGRGARFEEWADPRLSVETVLTRVREASGVSDEEALALWRSLARGDVGSVRSWRWR